MHVGMAVVFQNPSRTVSDHEVYRDELRLAGLAEPLGFGSIWGVEHHFTSYAMGPDVLQFLSYMAGTTRRIQLGSMVVVLPWHDPMRVAEQVSMLDAMSDGRFVFGMGRGLGRVEFEGFRLDMEESRATFVESAQMILRGLEDGYCEFDGKFVRQPRRDIRPRPRTSFRGRSYAAAVSPESSRLVAELGLGILIIPQKPWEMVAEELAEYRRIYRDVNDAEAPAPISSGWVFCDESPDRAEELARRYIGGYWQSVVDHYELDGDHFARTRGYESYARTQEMVNSEGGLDAMIEFFLGLQVWGTPEQCFDRVVEIQKRIGSRWFNGVFSYAAMPYAEAERNLRLFASKVRPELEKLEL